MASSSSSSSEQLFLSLLRSQNIRDHLFPLLSTSDLCSIRRTSSACCNLLTKPLFTRITVTFTASTFTKPCRISALSRIGHHIEHLTFHFAHSDSTFLPPLVHPRSGEEICFLYTPHTSMDSALTRPKYANSELGDILMQQYPPLFHAATNVPSFINAMHHLANLRHLTVRCPGQHASERYRRDIVDYALISLRIAMERAPVKNLHKLSLSLHPSGLNYFRHVTGFGSVPSAGRRWKQIRKLHMAIESWDFNGPSPGLDHLKIIEDYIRTLSPTLEKLSFTWLGERGPCPVALSADNLFAAPRSSKKLFHEVTSPMSPLPCRPPRGPIHLPQLRQMQIRNARMSATQLKTLITSHRDTVKEFDFDNVLLSNNGDWEDALAPVRNDRTWSQSNLTSSSAYSLVTSDSSDNLPTVSAAVRAASKELLDVDLGGSGFSDAERDIIEGLSSEVAEAREASMSFTTKLKKKRVKRRRRRPSKDEEVLSGSDRPVTPKHSRQNSRTETPPKPSPVLSRPVISPPIAAYRPVTPKEQRQASPPPLLFKSTPSPSPKYRQQPSPQYSLRPSLESARPLSTIPDECISHPLLFAEPQPVLLQPTVYDPNAPYTGGDQGISAVQRNIEQEEAHRLLAEDASARVSALQKAKEAVINKLSREFSMKKSRAADALAVTACRTMANRDYNAGICSREILMDERRVMGSRQSMLVPLMFAR